MIKRIWQWLRTKTRTTIKINHKKNSDINKQTTTTSKQQATTASNENDGNNENDKQTIDYVFNYYKKQKGFKQTGIVEQLHLTQGERIILPRTNDFDRSSIQWLMASYNPCFVFSKHMEIFPAGLAFLSDVVANINLKRRCMSSGIFQLNERNVRFLVKLNLPPG